MLFFFLLQWKNSSVFLIIFWCMYTVFMNFEISLEFMFFIYSLNVCYNCTILKRLGQFSVHCIVFLLFGAFLHTSHCTVSLYLIEHYFPIFQTANSVSDQHIL